MPSKLTVAVSATEPLIVEQLAAALKRFDITVKSGGNNATCRFELTETDVPTHLQGYRFDINEKSIRVRRSLRVRQNAVS